jgi:uncharacterized protein (TIGR02246 family)
MRDAMIGFAVLLCVACSGAGDANVSQAGSSGAHDPAAVQRAIDSSLAVFGSAIARGDTATAASIFAPDAMLLAGGGPIVRGRAGVAQWNAAMFSAYTISNPSFSTKDLIVTGDYAIETGEYRMTMKPKNGPALPDTGKYVTVWQRQSDGSWKILRDIFNSNLSQN